MYRLEYQYGVFHLCAAKMGLSEDRFIVAIEGGDNINWYHTVGTRVRGWDVRMIGTFQQVLQQAVVAAGDCEGGNLKPEGEDCYAEEYITRIRSLVESPFHLTTGWWKPRLCVPPDHAILADVKKMGFAPELFRVFNWEFAVVRFAEYDYPEYFKLVDRYAGELAARSFAEIGGLSKS